METIKIGQIGICHEHAAAKMQSLRALNDVFEVVGVVDDRGTTAAKFPNADLSPYEGLAWLAEDELFTLPGLQAVTIETPNLDLVPTAIRCMERGLAMHMDKPGGDDLALFGHLLEGCRVQQLPFQMGYMLRNNPALQFAQRALLKNWLGAIFEVQANMSHHYGGEAYQEYLSNFSGGILFNLGCHPIDMIVAMLGRPDNVTPFLKSVPGSPVRSMNNGLAIMEYPQAYVMCHACSREVDGQRYRRFKLCGTKGSIDICPLERFDGEPLTLRLTLREGNVAYSAGTHIVDFGIQRDRYRDQLLEWAQVINGEIENPYTYAHDYLVQEVVLAAAGITPWNRA